MKIVKLQAENVKRLRAVEITPDGSVVKITGKNGQGKTSVLDSIWMALGGADAIPGRPIHGDEERGVIKLDLGDLLVERRFTAKGTQLIVSNKDGARFASPQKMLDQLVGRLTFDPLQFMRLDTKKQGEILRDLCGLDFTAIDNERTSTYSTRTHVNREVKDLEGQLAGLPLPEEGTPTDEVDVGDLARQLQEANAHNHQLEEARQAIDTKTSTRDQVAQLVEDLRQELHEAETRLAALVDEVQDLQIKVDEIQPEDTRAIIAKMDSAKAINEQVRRQHERDRVESKLAAKRHESDTLTQKIGQLDSSKQRQTREAKLPVGGLGFDADGAVTYNDYPLDQASSAEQLRISMAMAMALNPKLRVLRITDGSLLDSDSMRVIEDMANQGDFQVWLECVDESGSAGVVIDDGAVQPPVTPADNAAPLANHG